MKFLIRISFLFLLFSCSEQAKIQRDFSELPTYPEYVKQTQAKTISTTEKLEERKKRFFVFMNEEIPFYWIGTKWDFNGTTREPKKGAIACGYFVTTVLSDFGLKLERVYLAQQASSVMIKQLCEPTSVKYFASVQKVKDFVLARSEQEVYIVGLDFHTGFVIRDGKDVYFFHSSYVEKEGVVKEKLEESPAFANSESYMIGSIVIK